MNMLVKSSLIAVMSLGIMLGVADDVNAAGYSGNGYAVSSDYRYARGPMIFG